MIRELTSAYLADYLVEEEYITAADAHIQAPWKITMGYEAEVFQSALCDTVWSDVRYPTDDDWEALLEAASKCGYEVDDNDAIYELKSPYAKHPLALEIATRGVVKSGYLPYRSSGLVGVHANLGIYTEDIALYEDSFIRLLRMVELLRGTTARRLSRPVTLAVAKGTDIVDDKSWNCSGTLGVALEKGFSDPFPVSSKARVEFRTLGYWDPSQLGTGLELLYYLGHGVTARPGSPLRQVWEELEQWFKERTDLPDHDTHFSSFEDRDQLDSISTYLQPYASRIARNKNADIQQKVFAADLDIRHLLGMDEISTHLLSN